MRSSSEKRTILILKNWDKPDFFRQTPNNDGVWKNFKFTCDQIFSCDYVIVMNYSIYRRKVFTYKENIWSLQQEPPSEHFKSWHRANKAYHRVFTTDVSLKKKRYVHSQPAIPWLVNKSYRYLVFNTISDKKLKLSWITSTKDFSAGHKRRMRFFTQLVCAQKKKEIDLDIIATYEYYLRDKMNNKTKQKLLKESLYTQGYNKVVENKWAGLTPYRYSLVIENFCGSYYWSEKLSDCFLAGTMPIYYGCSNLSDYFPKESYVQIDITDPKSLKKINEVVNSNLWLKRRKAIEKAKELVLNKYQFFPFMYNQIIEWEREKKGRFSEKTEIVIPNENNIPARLKFAAWRVVDLLKKNR